MEILDDEADLVLVVVDDKKDKKQEFAVGSKFLTIGTSVTVAFFAFYNCRFWSWSLWYMWGVRVE